MNGEQIDLTQTTVTLTLTAAQARSIGAFIRNSIVDASYIEDENLSAFDCERGEEILNALTATLELHNLSEVALQTALWSNEVAVIREEIEADGVTWDEE